MWLPVGIASLEGFEVERARSATLLEQLRREERATLGVDPDGTAYLDLSERIEIVRAAYMKQLAEEELAEEELAEEEDESCFAVRRTQAPPPNRVSPSAQLRPGLPPRLRS